MVRAFISLSEKLFRYILIFCNKSNLDYTQNAKSNFRFTLPLAHQQNKKDTQTSVLFVLLTVRMDRIDPSLCFAQIGFAFSTKTDVCLQA